MSDKLCPPNPSEVMVIRKVTPNIVTLSVPFLRFGRIPIGGRATLVKLTSGSLAIFSPVALTDGAKEAVSALGGPVKYIIALDIEHHLFVSEWKAAYPDAAIIGPEGLPEKRLQQRDVRVGRDTFDVVFTRADKHSVRIGADFDADLVYEYVDAHPNREIVFCYRGDGGVLIQADYLFNLPAREQYSRVPEAQRPRPGVLTRLFSALTSTEGEAKGIKRLLWYVMSRADRPSWNESAKRIQAWTFRTVVPCHGDVLEGNGKEVFQKVFAWHLPANKG